MNRNKSNRGRREGEKESGKGFAAVVTGYGKAGMRSRAIPARNRPPTGS